MTAILVIATLCMMVFGYFVMRRIDSFLGRTIITPSKEISNSPGHGGVLVYGSDETVSAVGKLGFVCTRLQTHSFPDGGRYSALFALSENDPANYILCREAKLRNPGIYIVVRCSNQELLGAFEDLGAERILGPGEPLPTMNSPLPRAG